MTVPLRVPHRSLLPLAALAALAALLAACARGGPTRAPAPARVTTGESVLRSVQERYAGKGYRTLTFRRTVTQSIGGTERKSTQYATVMVPSRVRYDIDLARGTGQLFASDSQYNVLNNQVRRAAAGHSAVAVLGFDVYAQPAARTSQVLRSLGFPDGPVRDGMWLTRPVWVIGGSGPSDVHSPQVWIEKERLLVVRVLQPLPADTTQTYDIRFGDFRPAAGAFVAARIEHYQNGQRTLLEEYDDLRVDPTVSEALFDPRRWGTAPHWARTR